MKITFLIHGIGIAGGIRAVFECSNHLVKRGHKVNLVYPSVLLKITPQYSVPIFFEQFLRTAGNLRRGVKVDWFDVRANLVRVFSLSPKFVRNFQKDIPDADLIVATSWETAYSLQNISESKGRKTYFVQHYEVWDMWNSEDCWNKFNSIDPNHSSRGIAMNEVSPDDPYIKQMKELVDRSYKLPYCKITTSSWLKELLEKNFNEKVYGLIPIGNNLDIFGVKEFRQKSSKKLKILMSYRGIKWKGDDDGIKALETVKKQFPDVEIILFGNMNNTQMPGWAEYIECPSDEQLNRLYQEADIFVFPSWVEGWGSPPMEAMACGSACVTTDVGAVKDYSLHGETALIVPPRSPEKIAQAIISLIKDNEKRLKIARGGFEYIKKFTWEHTVNALEKAFNSIISSRVNT